jgi:hypothetical protein
MPLLRAIPVFVVALSFTGCPLFFDPASVSLLDGGAVDATRDDDATQPDSGSDASTSGDMTVSTDAGTDGGRDMRVADVERDVARDMLVDLGPTGEPCPGAHPELPGDCNLVTQEPCSASEVCEVVLVQGEPSRQCRQKEPGFSYDLPAGQGCDPGSPLQCQPHLFCRAGFCVKYCNLQNGFGCDPGEFCASHEPGGTFAGLGYCTAACP